MTNRKWLNSLSNEDFVSWVLDREIYINANIEDDKVVFNYVEPSPKLETLKFRSTNTRSYLAH